MASPFRAVLAACVAFALFGSAAIAAEPSADEQFVYYQDKLLGKESGVYEQNGYLFVLVRIPSASGNRIRMKGMALQEFSAQLRRWALEQTARDRGEKPSYPAAIAWMAAFNDEADPNWRFPQWRVNIAGRQFPARETGGFYIQGQVYKKDALVKAIPDSYRRQPTSDEILLAFARNAAAVVRKDKRAFAAQCGFFELPLSGSKDLATFPDPENRLFPKKLESFLLDARNADVGKANKEWKSLNKAFATALCSSTICGSFMTGREVVNETVSTVSVTNPVVSMQSVTNQVVSVPDDGATTSVTNYVVTAKSGTNLVASTMTVTNRTVSVVRDDSDRMLLSAGLLRREPKPLTFAAVLPAANATADEIRVALRTASTDPRLWKAIAARYKADGQSALSLSCLLNALALTPSGTDIVAEIALRYDELGCPELARGAALFAFGAAKDEMTRAKVKPLLLR